MAEPEIAQAAVVAHADTSCRISRRPRRQIDLRTCADRLAARLPDYMVPAAFVILDALPLTPNGKLDRKALPAPEGSGLAAAYVAPTTPDEILLCDLVREFLGFERVGLADNFFHLGGHSLMATRLAARIRARLGRELPIRTIFDTPVLGDLAPCFAHAPEGRPAAHPAAAAGRTAALFRASPPLVPAQTRRRESELQHSGRGQACKARWISPRSNRRSTISSRGTRVCAPCSWRRDSGPQQHILPH